MLCFLKFEAIKKKYVLIKWNAEKKREWKKIYWRTGFFGKKTQRLATSDDCKLLRYCGNVETAITQDSKYQVVARDTFKSV